ncbi:hypothetical protein A7U60_g8839 [Sanghuangporus baumii]|uniref:Cytochrome b561 domain-containing protein n=1 Tax=Sanghuangporus baumii TaxID=108892 RepID=A0A9Q5HQK2_SANBA|nr:hypothetical protein A7U60_g8839 [Sanghuangporus baumii]
MHTARYSDDAARESVDSVEIFDVDSSEKDSVASASAGGGYSAGGGSGGSSLRVPPRPASLRSARREERRFDGVARTVALTFSTISTVYTTYLIASSNPRSLSWFAYHPPLQMASLTLFTLGILSLQPASQPKAKAAGLVRHQLCMLLAGAPLLAAGTWVIYHSKEVKARQHFTSWHGTIGIIAVGWLAIQMLVGCASVWFGGAAFGGGMKAKNVWKYHRLSGYLVYPLLLYAAHLGGAWSTYTNAHANPVMRIIAFSVGPIITVIAVFSRIRYEKIQIRQSVVL